MGMENQLDLKNKQTYDALLDHNDDGDMAEYIGEYNELSDWEKDNEFLIRGYRINYTNWSSLIKSTCIFHNETINIWTHLIPALSFIALIIVFEYIAKDD